MEKIAYKVQPFCLLYQILLLERHLEMLVSMWSITARIDEVIQPEEIELINNFSNIIENDLLEEDIENKKILKFTISIEKEKVNNFKKRINYLFDTPLPFTDIKKYAIDNGYEVMFYEQALLIVAADGKLEIKENEFVNIIAKELSISTIDKTMLDNKLMKNIKLKKRGWNIFK